MRAVLGIRESGECRPCWARSIARSSRVSEIENKNARAVASPMRPSSTEPMAAMVVSNPAPGRPRPLAVNRRVSVPGTNVHAPAARPSVNAAGETAFNPVHSRISPAAHTARPRRRATREHDRATTTPSHALRHGRRVRKVRDKYQSAPRSRSAPDSPHYRRLILDILDAGGAERAGAAAHRHVAVRLRAGLPVIDGEHHIDQ